MGWSYRNSLFISPSRLFTVYSNTGVEESWFNHYIPRPNIIQSEDLS